MVAEQMPFDPAVFGVAGTTVAILLYILRVLWSDNRALRAENNELAATALAKLTEVATESSHQLAESSKSLEAATVMMHQIAGRPSLTPEQIYELASLLRDLRQRPHS